MKTLLIALLLALPVTAATRTWNGSVTTSWSEPANWDEHAVPANGDDLLFPRSANFTSVNDLPAGLVVHSITINANGVRISGNAIVLDVGGITVNNQFLSSQIFCVLDFLSVTLNASQTWTGLAHTQETTVGRVNVNGKTLRITGGSYDLNSPAGTGSIINLAGASTIGSTWTGTLFVDGGAFFLNGLAGDARIDAGMLVLSRAATHEIVVNGGGTLEVDNFSNGGPSVSRSVLITPAAGAPSTVRGGFTVFNSILLQVVGTLTLNNAKLALNGDGPNTAGSTLVIFSNDGNDFVDGTFMGLPEGAILNTGGASDQISYRGGDGNDVTLTVLDTFVPSTTIGLTSSANPSLPEQPVTFTATVSTSQGSVDFFDGTFRVGTAPLDASGRASLTLPLGPGTHTITAAYTGTPSQATSQASIEQRVIGRRHAAR
ncbi:MAG TPA: Ig-like domain-containing protein [Gemmatimonadaceae bacterium]|jgi:hypothetical protein|nr:Ig-like domain-containing protein [Gemmatimonadaceae bacterium]